MDITERKITKIAREAEKLVLLTMREEGVGTAEIDLIPKTRDGRPERPTEPAAFPHRKGREPEILQGRN